MARKRVLIQTLLALAVVWAAVAGIRSLAGSKRVTAEKIEARIAAANFDDWSEGVPEGAVMSDREDEIRAVAEQFNRLDFAERDKAREQRVGESFFRKMAPEEKELFIELTIAESMRSFMAALDAMQPEERRKMVERGLREIEDGRTEADMRRAEELDEDLLNRITEEGMKAYFEEASSDTKLDLAPLMEAMDGVMKGLRGNEFGPPEAR